MQKFKSAAECLTSIGSMQWATQAAQANRAKINKLFNGDPVWTDEERILNRMNTNINWLEPTRIAANARHQIYNAFFSPGDFFDIRLGDAPEHKKDQWSRCLTKYINRALRRDKRFRSALEQAFAQTVLHGPGPMIWRNKHSPSPSTLGVDDVLVPAGTLADFSNLDCLAVYREWSWGELYDMTQGNAVDPGWNKGYVDKLLQSLYKQPLQPLYQGNRYLFPEKIAEDVKENASLFAASALPKVLAWDFYFLNEDGKWNRRVLLDYNNLLPDGLKSEFDPKKKHAEFLYSQDDYADEWQNILHLFVGNCSNVAPFRYYSIRSIGYLLYGPGLTQNTIRCRATDHVLQSLLTWFRNVSEDDRERLEDIQLHHLGIFPDGLSMVTAQERYEVDWNLINGALNQNRQLMAESATSFLPDIAVEGEKPAMTATESLIRNNASVTLTSAVLNQLYNQAEPLYREICRRFCLKDKRDPMVKRVLEEMKEDEIPESVMDDVDSWEIIPNRVMGGGNKAVELTTARALFEIRGALGPDGALQATRKYVLALTNDAEDLDSLVPETPEIGNSSVLAQLSFGTLMEGVPMQQKGTLNEQEYIETLIQMMAAAMAPLQALQEQPQALAVNAERIAGLVNVGGHVEQHIQMLSQDASAKDKVNEYQRVINQLMQQLKAYGQRITEMEQAQAEQQGQGGLPAEAQAKIVTAQILAQNKAQITAQNAQIKNQHKDAAFMADQHRKDAGTVAEIRRKDVLTQADVAAKDLTTRAGLLHQARQAQQDREESAAEPKAE